MATSTESVLQPRAQLSSLPDEIKAHIARMCAEQDEAIRAAMEETAERFGGYEEPYSAIQSHRRMSGHSLGSLYQTSKEWRDFAAPHRFKHLNWRMLCNERFRFDYVHRFGRFFVSLDTTPASHIDGFIHLAEVISLLPNITRIKVGDYERLFA
ncbi:hypothetical protein JCM10908_002240 [Rhodotorula pacifica]|uniref:uncharacterized protein n=1 Tax=Rhodotorula pacifica TaxID=1495444 RepID=UPI00317770B9